MTDDNILPDIGFPPIVIGSVLGATAFLIAFVTLGIIVHGQKGERIRMAAARENEPRPKWLYYSPTGRGLMERK